MNAFVLSGGANLGAEQAGMLESLFEAGIIPDLLVGTSIGAANATYVAADPTLGRARSLAALWRGVRPRDVFPINPLRIAKAALRGGALFSSEPLRELLEREIPFDRIEDAATPLRIVATAFDDGSEVVFDRGPVVDAVLASTALPAVFPPHEIAGRLYLDGGLVDHVPLRPAMDAGATTIYVLSVGFPCPPPVNHRSARAVLVHSVGLLLSQRVRLDGVHLPDQDSGLRIIQLPPVCSEVGLRDFSHSAELIDRARDQTSAFLAGLPRASCEHQATGDLATHIVGVGRPSPSAT
ncbi:MAG: patatin-like phospholipase family protein [Actinomycetota bacterium]